MLSLAETFSWTLWLNCNKGILEEVLALGSTGKGVAAKGQLDLYKGHAHRNVNMRILKVFDFPSFLSEIFLGLLRFWNCVFDWECLVSSGSVWQPS